VESQKARNGRTIADAVGNDERPKATMPKTTTVAVVGLG